jgi:hypothetical protein
MAAERLNCHTDQHSGTTVTLKMNSFIALSKYTNTRDASPLSSELSFSKGMSIADSSSFPGYPSICRSRACNRTS